MIMLFIMYNMEQILCYSLTIIVGGELKEASPTALYAAYCSCVCMHPTAHIILGE